MTDNRLAQWAFRHGITPQAWHDLQHLYDNDPPDNIPSGPEATVVAALRAEAPKLGNSLWRNNTGATLDSNDRMVRYGLGNDSKRLNEVWKSSDLIGITPRIIAGHRVGIFTAVEVKAPGWRGPRAHDEHEQAQANFLRSVEAKGGIGMFVTSIEEYRARVVQS